MSNVIFTVEKTSTGFSAFANHLPIYTVGGTMDELKSNISDALSTYDNLRELAFELKIESQTTPDRKK